MPTPDLLTGLMSFGVFLYSTTVHEAAHAWTAWKLGDDTAYRGGQVAFLNPIPHVRREPIGMVVVPLLTYFTNGWMMGWASAPYSPLWARAYPRRSAVMALAGPAANLALVLLATLAIRVGTSTGVFEAPDRVNWLHVVDATQAGPWQFPAALLSVMFSLNLLLCAFNLLPLPPLDGASLPLLFLRGRAAETYTHWALHPSFAFVGLLVAWKVFGPIYPVLRNFALALLYPGLHYS